MVYKMTHPSPGLIWGEIGPALGPTCPFSVRLARLTDTTIDRCLYLRKKRFLKKKQLILHILIN